MINKKVLGGFSFLLVSATPIIANIVGLLRLSWAIGLFLFIFGAGMFGGLLYFLIKMADFEETTDLAGADVNEGHASVLDGVNQSIEGMEGRDTIDTFRGNELRLERQVKYDLNQEPHTFFGIVGMKKKEKNKVVVIYSPTAADPATGSKIWRYIDDPPHQMLSNPFHRFKPFGGRGKRLAFNREKDRQDKDDSSGTLEIDVGGEDDEYEDLEP